MQFLRAWREAAALAADALLLVLFVLFSDADLAAYRAVFADRAPRNE